MTTGDGVTRPNGAAAAGAALRSDLRLIADVVAPGSRVLDVGCGDGALLAHLAEQKGVDARGIELSQAGVHECVSQGLAVVQGDADTDLAIYPDQSFDYVILSQTIQAMRKPSAVLAEMLRIGRYGIVSFTNYAHWRSRLRLGLKGRIPVARCLPEPWYVTTYIHPCTVSDFEALCAEMRLGIERRVFLRRDGEPGRLAGRRGLANLFGEQAVFVLTRPGGGGTASGSRDGAEAAWRPASR
jgi:methionine biosynthesis protein MetW